MSGGIYADGWRKRFEGNSRGLKRKGADKREGNVMATS